MNVAQEAKRKKYFCARANTTSTHYEGSRQTDDEFMPVTQQRFALDRPVLTYLCRPEI